MTVEEARERRKELEREEHRIECGYSEALAEIEEKRETLQRDCPHENVTKSEIGFGRLWITCKDCGVDLETGNGEVDRG